MSYFYLFTEDLIKSSHSDNYKNSIINIKTSTMVTKENNPRHPFENHWCMKTEALYFSLFHQDLLNAKDFSVTVSIVIWSKSF